MLRVSSENSTELLTSSSYSHELRAPSFVSSCVLKSLLSYVSDILSSEHRHESLTPSEHLRESLKSRRIAESHCWLRESWRVADIIGASPQVASVLRASQKPASIEASAYVLAENCWHSPIIAVSCALKSFLEIVYTISKHRRKLRTLSDYRSSELLALSNYHRELQASTASRVKSLSRLAGILLSSS
jgi:zinc transporter ZupT